MAPFVARPIEKTSPLAPEPVEKPMSNDPAGASLSTISTVAFVRPSEEPLARGAVERRTSNRRLPSCVTLSRIGTRKVWVALPAGKVSVPDTEVKSTPARAVELLTA